MLSDRSYMRSDYPRQKTSVVMWLICTIIAGFVLQNVAVRWLGLGPGETFHRLFALSSESILTGKVWTLATYSLLHSMGNFFHLLGNLLGIFFIGRILENAIGDRRLLWLYVGGVLSGGIIWLALHWGDRGWLLGASAGVGALLMMFAAMQPNRSITLLLFFILPVTIKPKWLIICLGGFDLFGFLFFEAVTGSGINGIAHSAHLGGYAFGWLFYRYGFLTRSNGRPSIELPAWLKRRKKTPAQEAPAYTVNMGTTTSGSTSSATAPSPPREVDLAAEVDRILDKINTHGFGALTDTEKRILDRAKDRLNRR